MAQSQFNLVVVTLVAGACCVQAANPNGGTDSRLADLLMQGDSASARALIGRKTVDVNAAQGDGMTPLHWAAYQDDLQTAKLLIAAGANVNAQTRLEAITPLFLASANGDPELVAQLLKAGADAKSVKPNGTTVLMVAAAAGNLDAVKVLVEHGAEIDSKEKVHEQTALMFAAALNRSEVVKYLLAHHADANAATLVRKMEHVRYDMDGNVVEEGKAPKAKAGAPPADPVAELNALAKSIGFDLADVRFTKPRSRAGDIAARSPRRVGADFSGGMTALLYAAREGHMATVEALLAGGANVNQTGQGDKITPIVMAIVNGHLDVAKYLLDHGADPNLASNTNITPLYAVIDVQWAPKTWYPQPSVDQEKTRYLDLMEALIEKGANVNTAVGAKPWFRSFTNDYTWVDPAGATPFWRAAQSSDIEAMKLLVKHGADPKIATKAGDTPLHAAAGIGWAANWSVNAPYPAIDAVKYCVELGDDVNKADLRGYTALHGAAYIGNDAMIEYLVAKGANVKAKSKAGDAAADMANGPTRFGQPHPETVALLEKLGSPNTHNCRSDQCVVAAKSQIYDERTPADFVANDQLDALAKSIGLTAAEYRVDYKNSPPSAAKAGDKAKTGSDRN
ncbi:MAG TPA: ankyrin repeat domain-containing protein [Bryobacteraceae bacterium]|jgi:ankyrin repeat protein